MNEKSPSTVVILTEVFPLPELFESVTMAVPSCKSQLERFAALQSSWFAMPPSASRGPCHAPIVAVRRVAPCRKYRARAARLSCPLRLVFSTVPHFLVAH